MTEETHRRNTAAYIKNLQRQIDTLYTVIGRKDVQVFKLRKEVESLRAIIEISGQALEPREDDE